MKNFISRYIYTILAFVFIFSSLSFKPLSNKDDNINSEPSEKFESTFFNKKSITDGPYIFYENDEILVKWIQNNHLKEKVIHENNFKIINRKFGFDFEPNWIVQNNTDSINYIQNYTGVENLIAVSDVHGQYNLLIKLLRKHKVIDKHYNWIFDKGHLVILGDVFDRGSKVTEILWLIYRLEQQAKEKGGMVHVMLGNHELMVLNNDLRYVHEKYTQSANLMSTTFNQLYSSNSFLGKWLRKKPVLVKINDMQFVHAGVSPKIVRYGFTQSEINECFINKIIDKSKKSVLADSSLALLRGKDGPVWYRGYFSESKITEQEVNGLLNYFDAKHIIVGHTSMPNIVSYYDKKIIGIDSSIKNGDSGEILIFKNNEFYRGTSNGALIKL
ncbi:MAG: metallophosphoesterase [Bacteroidales bacterium]|nr:metallophosphoesterase [Bacteroidales bacterium]